MKVLILSDIHITDSDDLIMKRKSELVKAINTQVEFDDTLLLLIVGDIANKGKVEEYIYAEEMITYLKEHIHCELRIGVVPGNHDNYFVNDIDEKNRESDLNNLIFDKSCSVENLMKLKDVQVNFRKFHDSVVCLDPLEVVNEDRFLESYILEIDGINIQLNCFNSAWSSKKKSIGREIVFPVDYDVSRFKKKSNALISMSIFHYPLNWMENESNNYFHTQVKNESDFIIIGHEHEEDIQYEKNYINNNSCISLKSPPLQTESKSMFSILDIDTQRNMAFLTIFKYVNDRYIIENSIDINEYKDLSIIDQNDNKYKSKLQFKKFLSSYGVDISHPQFINFKFRDLYVTPQFKVKSETLYDKTDLKRKNFIDEININYNSVILGGSDYGKTAYLKHTYHSLYSRGEFPVYIDLAKQKNIRDVTNLSRIVYAYYREQYELPNISDMQQEPNEKKYILIDNIDKYQGDIEKFLKILSDFFKEYKKWMITSADIFIFDPYVNKNEDKIFDHEFNEYELISFGAESREKLIRKWVELNPSIDDVDKKLQVIREFDEMISQLVRTQLLEPIPLYLIVIMQAHDSNASFNLNQSSKPHFYNYLILDAYMKLNLNTRSINLFERFLSHLAYSITFSELKISYNDLYLYHSEFIKKNLISNKSPEIFYFERFIRSLLDVKILIKIDDAFKFKYDYHFCFYISKYLVKDGNVGRDDMILNLVETIDKELSANTLNYCIYHSNDNLIFNVIKDKANSIFSDANEFQMNDDIKEFNSKYKAFSPSDFEITYIQDVEKSRIKVKRDIDEAQRALYEEPSELEGIDMDFVNKMNESVRTMEVLGGILKNGLIDLDGEDKVQLGIQSVSIGLRTITVLLDKISSELLNIFEEYANTLDTTTFNIDEIKKVRASIYYMVKFSVYTVLTKTADVIANSNDDVIFNKVFKEKTISKEFMHFMIKTFYFGDLDIDYIDLFIGKYKSNTLAIDCVRDLISAYNVRYRIQMSKIAQIRSVFKKHELGYSGNIQSDFIESLESAVNLIK